jgi:hypothetical protein
MIADFKCIRYKKSVSSDYYQKQPDLVPFKKMPEELKVEETHDPQIKRNGAEQVIRGRVYSGRYLFFTGLIPSTSRFWYIGNHCEFVRGNKKISLILFCFSSEFRELTVYFFNGFSLYPSERERFVQEFVNQINR